MSSWVACLFIIIILILTCPVQADIRTIPPGGTIFIGEEQLDISGSGIGPGSQIAWWAPGTSLVETPADTVTVGDPTRFSALSSLFSGKEGIWYSLAEKTPILKIKQPRLKVRISDTTSDFDATGKWLPKGHIASLQIETNLYEIRSRDGITGSPIDITIKSPQGSVYTAVSGPKGSFSLTGILVNAALYDTGGVWNTGGTDPGTYTIQAECTTNRLNTNNPDPGAGVSEPIWVLIQDINPLITRTNTSNTSTTQKAQPAPVQLPSYDAPSSVNNISQAPTPGPGEPDISHDQKPESHITLNQSVSPTQAPSLKPTLSSTGPTPDSTAVPPGAESINPVTSPTHSTPLPAMLGILALGYVTMRRW